MTAICNSNPLASNMIISQSPLDNFGLPVCRFLNQVFSIPVGVARLRRDLGWKGYGIYCAIIDMLSQLPSLSFVCDYDIVAFKLGTSADIVKDVIENYALFCKEGSGISACFYSVELRNLNNSLENVRRQMNHCIAVGIPASDNTQSQASKSSTTATKLQTTSTETRASAGGLQSSAAEIRAHCTAYSLADNRGRLREDKKWLDDIAMHAGKKIEMMPLLFDAFADYVETREDIRHNTEREMRSHFINWLKRGYGDAAAKAAKKREEEIKNKMRKEEERRRDHEEYVEHSKQCINYAEYCRRRGIETSGNIVDDIALVVEKRKAAAPAPS